MQKNLVFGMLFGTVLFLPSCSLKQPIHLVENLDKEIILRVEECPEGFVDGVEKWREFYRLEYVNEDRSGERMVYVVDPKRSGGIGIIYDLWHKDVSTEPMVRIAGVATDKEVTAYRKGNKWFCFSGAASWLSLTDHKIREKNFIYWVVIEDSGRRAVKLYEWEGRRILGKVLVWNWKPPKSMHDGKRKYPDVDYELELGRWEIR